MITVFKNYKDTSNPKYFEIDTVLGQIKSCSVQTLINKIRSEKDEKKKKELKGELPCILFAGKFTTRNDKAITEHSGYVVLDWDKLADVDAKKKEICELPFVYACFVSPSGNGIKAVVKIPPIIEKHRGYYRGLMTVFSDLDVTSINESRVCYASCDKAIYVNKNAIEFLVYVEEKKQPRPNFTKINTTNDYAKAEIALKIIRNAVDGQKHKDLIKASKLMGGFIAGGIIDEAEGIRLLENEASVWDNLEKDRVTIRKGVDYGKVDPIQLEERIKTEYVSKTQSVISVEDEDMSFLANEERVKEYIKKWRDGTFEVGGTTGIPSLDKNFVFKRGNFNVVNGFDNVGKSTALWYLCLLSAIFHGWKWILYSNENRSGAVIKKLIEFYWGEPINRISDYQLEKATIFVNEHFTLISNEFLFNYKDILNITTKLLNKEHYDGLLIDPYNSLKIELSNNSKLSTHEYHYEAASEMQVYTKRNDICIYLNCHVITGAMRFKSGEKQMPPQKADTEGGGKFSNKADDFMTFHREVQDAENFTKMQIHVRKIKEVETGGGYTPYESPYILEMKKGMCGYMDSNGFDPIENWRKPIQTTAPLKPNTEFYHDPTEPRKDVESFTPLLEEPPF